MDDALESLAVAALILFFSFFFVRWLKWIERWIDRNDPKN